MSAWSLAVWIVKKIEKNFNISKLINNYVDNLNDLNERVNTLNLTLETTKTNLQQRAVTILAKESGTTGEPEGNRPYGEGAIWLILSS